MSNESGVRAIRGMHDVLPDQTPQWRWLEQRLREVLESYGYQEIRFPILEPTSLFKRSIGEVTDIVEKEMYSFDDRNGESLTLRPEGTAGCVRACLEHGLLHQGQVRRLWYQGPMFRYERPQKGRYRQFHQVGVECYGLAGPDIDLEMLLLSQRLLRSLGLKALRLEINTLGTAEERAQYRERLIAYWESHHDQLDEDARRRLHSNPLRIFDSKNPAMAPLIAAAPVLGDYLGESSRASFAWLCQSLTEHGIDYCHNPRLVRGLDYYSQLVFEWITTELGAQGTVCAGGRYDSLITQLGGPAVPAVGFAMGEERLLALLPAIELPAPVDIYLIKAGARAVKAGTLLAEQLREAMPQLRILDHCGGGSFKSQFKKADASGARWALVLGDQELDEGVVACKPLREEGEQSRLPLEGLSEALSRLLELV